MLLANPNFPENLAIKPNTARSATSHSELEGDSFGAAAQEGSIRKYGIAGRVWEAAHTMIAYFEQSVSAPEQLDPPLLDAHRLANDDDGDVSVDRRPPPVTFLELGSGTGIVAAYLVNHVLSGDGDTVIATDLLDVCPLLESNLQAPCKPNRSLHIRPLAWGNHEHALDIHAELFERRDRDRCSSQPRKLKIICSDLVYFPQLLAPLLRSLLHLTSPPFVSCEANLEDVEIVMSYKIRSLPKETPFWTAFGLWFTFAPVLVRSEASDTQPASWTRFCRGQQGDDMFIFIARRRPGSLDWAVPQNDQDLMSGVGAEGSQSRKGDDTFETLLMMGLDVNDLALF